MLRVYFMAHTLFVQEILGPKNFVRSQFIRNIVNLHDFGPKGLIPHPEEDK